MYYSLFAKETPPHRSWDSFSASFVLHLLGLALLPYFVARTAQTVQRIDTQNFVLLAPASVTPQPTNMMPPPVRVIAPPPVMAELRIPVKLPLARPEPVPEARPVLPETRLETPTLPPPAPVVPLRKREVVMNTFSNDPGGNTGSSAQPTIADRLAREVQTGGFGDPDGLPGQGRKDAALRVASLGSFDLPGGPGYGNGTGGKRGVPGVIASAGFGNGVAAPIRGGNGTGHIGGRTAIAQAGFSDATAPVAAPKPRTVETIPALTPVEILEKPKPSYTDEARRQRVEGEVLLDVVFSATGEVHVVRVVKGLGHGLDEAALQAAQRIRFRPARRDGQPYDSAAVVHINFALAE